MSTSPLPSLSVVVVVHDMARELPRTLATLAPGHQQGIDAGDYEVVVVDNGSAVSIARELIDGFGGRIRVERLDPAPPSPARAANLGIERADGDLVGLIVDGARMASPGLLSWARRAVRLADRPVVSTLGWHLGPVRHMEAAEAGYDQAVEDELLDGVDWRSDGYALFGISVLNGSSAWGWFEPMSESSALFLSASDWAELGGLDERFALPGGGLVNHDVYRRACALEGSELITVLGEGTFHQFHGGAATGSRLSWEEMHDEYVRVRGVPYASPPDRPILVGRYPESALEHMVESVAMARRAIGRRAR
ncbi:MAG: glycosyltransferase family A protein [Acidimicrobiales bacterium]